MARDPPEQTAGTDTQSLPNCVTIVGRGVPSSFELTVDGELEVDGEQSDENLPVVSGSVAEGTIDVGVQRFRFDGQVTNIHLVDWNGVPAPESASVPTVHVDYGAAKR
ncbi:hypothetical protein SAMN04487967_3584 [Natronorubrum sediminis]|uniref:Uncharacterized protein n=1 Tax=Natronorubrum sediminis TaxID=640943 RepID=A0A1H6G4U5_9EURY|nr:hypothetical protein [Natronorubrum sediminis]SEH18059.1 hypothetical protein SAMN04487967_3584 [Natronorubrum sediminis]